jgi:hypothetical protein
MNAAYASVISLRRHGKSVDYEFEDAKLLLSKHFATITNLVSSLKCSVHLSSTGIHQEEIFLGRKGPVEGRVTKGVSPSRGAANHKHKSSITSRGKTAVDKISHHSSK